MLSVENVEHNAHGSVTEMTVICSKQKDAEHFAKLEFQLIPVEGTASCVVVTNGRQQAKLEKQIEILQILINQGPMSWDAWASSTSKQNIPKTTFHRHFTELRNAVRIIKENGRWRAVS